MGLQKIPGKKVPPRSRKLAIWEKSSPEVQEIGNWEKNS